MTVSHYDYQSFTMNMYISIRVERVQTNKIEQLDRMQSAKIELGRLVFRCGAHSVAKKVNLFFKLVDGLSYFIPSTTLCPEEELLLRYELLASSERHSLSIPEALECAISEVRIHYYTVVNECDELWDARLEPFRSFGNRSASIRFDIAVTQHFDSKQLFEVA